MAATGWMYIVPYEPDIKQAFMKLQQRLFETRDYTLPIDDYKSGTISTMVFSTISDVLAACGLDGTHSALDIDADTIALEPFLRETVWYLFRTERPSRSMIDGRVMAKIFGNDPSPGYNIGDYLILYDDYAEAEIVFVGATGD